MYTNTYFIIPIVYNSFNKYFKAKIEALKDNIDDELKEDLLAKLRENLKLKPNYVNKSFNLKRTNEKEVKSAMKRMKRKKSLGVDGIPQEVLVQGAPSLASILTNIFNTSVDSGLVPKSWKEAVVTPVLKKGDTQVNSINVCHLRLNSGIFFYL